MENDGGVAAALTLAEQVGVLRLLSEVLRRSHLCAPSEVPAIIAEESAAIGADDVVLYLVDYDQTTLIPLLGPVSRQDEQLSVDGTVAGRCFSGTRIVTTPVRRTGGCRLWLPLLDGTDRVGVLGMSFQTPYVPVPLVEACERLAHLAAMLIIAKGAYGDTFEIARRRVTMTIASEFAWSLAPPSVFATDDLSLGIMLEPCYDNGGDAIDYATNDRVLHVGMFDAMGHGLAAAGVAAFAVAAYRHSRRVGRDLLETHASMHDAVGRQFPEDRFVTAIIARLDLDSGQLTWINAGHPPPLILRDGRRARLLESPATTPLGVALGGVATVATATLEPGDLVLLYTDGLTDARDSDGELFASTGWRNSSSKRLPRGIRRLKRCDASARRWSAAAARNCAMTRARCCSNGGVVPSTSCCLVSTPDPLHRPVCLSVRRTRRVRDPCCRRGCWLAKRGGRRMIQTAPEIAPRFGRGSVSRSSTSRFVTAAPRASGRHGCGPRADGGYVDPRGARTASWRGLSGFP